MLSRRKLYYCFVLSVEFVSESLRGPPSIIEAPLEWLRDSEGERLLLPHDDPEPPLGIGAP
jgi:hypothetical protein